MIGWLTERFNTARSLPKGIAVNIVGGIVVLYAFGITGMAIVLQLSLLQAATAALVFLPGDLVKAVLAALVARGVHQAMPVCCRRPREPTGSRSGCDHARGAPVGVRDRGHHPAGHVRHLGPATLGAADRCLLGWTASRPWPTCVRSRPTAGPGCRVR